MELGLFVPVSSIQRDNLSVHERGGLGSQGWQLLLPLIESNPVEYLLPSNLLPYARAVIADDIDDSNFTDREYLDRHDWQEVNRVVGGDRIKREFLDIISGRVKLPLEKDIAHYATLESYRAYTARDFILDEVANKKMRWNGERWETQKTVLEGYTELYHTGIYDSSGHFPVYEGGDPIYSYPYEPSENSELISLFMLARNTPLNNSIPPQKLYEILREQAANNPKAIQDRLDANAPMNPGIRYPRVNPRTLYPSVELATGIGPRKLREDLQEAYFLHFGVKPNVKRTRLHYEQTDGLFFDPPETIESISKDTIPIISIQLQKNFLPPGSTKYSSISSYK